jgi:glutaredoxin-related protein
MLRITTATHRMATEAPREPAAQATAEAPADEFDWSTVEVTMSEAQTRQFVTLYQALQGFDDRAAQASLACPRLCFAGSADEIDYSERWGGVQVHLARPLLERRAELEGYGWDVRVLDGLDHTQAMQAASVLPVLRPWLTAALAKSPS